jgi:glycosyltransferase involved in cell wall biosynthesis
MWQKNIELAIDAVAALARDGRGLRLVVAGAVDVKSAEYLAALRDRVSGAGLESAVEFIVDPSDEVLVDLYRRCLLLIFTARNEDFGMVPLEAMACGTPVLAVDRGGPRETVLDGRTGWLRPADTQVFADVIGTVLAAPASVYPMRTACVEQAAQFGWATFVSRVDDVLAGLVDVGVG